MKFDIPGHPNLEIDIVVLDLNGTLTIDGRLIDGAKERIASLKKEGLDFRLFTGDTLGTGQAIAQELGLTLHLTNNAEAKLEEGTKLGLERIAVIGNGRIDLELFKKAALRICTLQDEGVFAPLLLETDVLVKDIKDALDLLIYKKRLIATMRR